MANCRRPPKSTGKATKRAAKETKKHTKKRKMSPQNDEQQSPDVSLFLLQKTCVDEQQVGEEGDRNVEVESESEDFGSDSDLSE